MVLGRKCAVVTNLAVMLAHAASSFFLLHRDSRLLQRIAVIPAFAGMTAGFSSPGFSSLLPWLRSLRGSSLASIVATAK